MATIRKRVNKKGTSYQIDYYDPDGKRKMKCFKLKKEADAYLAKVGVSKKEGSYEEIFGPKKEAPTFAGLVADYLKNCAHQKSFRDKEREIRYAMEAFGEKRLKDLSYRDLELYRNRRKATALKSGKPRTDATVNREMAALKNMLNKGIEWGMLEVSPFRKGSRLAFRESNQRQRYLMEADIEKLLNSCSAHLLPIVEIALRTGMRKGEILSLKWDQIRNGFIYLEGGMVKSGKDRQLPLDGRAVQVLKELQIRNKWKSPFVFLGPDGERLKDVKKGFAGACRRAGIEDFRFHDLRHTFASHLVMKGANLKAVQRLLGHSDSKMTDRYSHLSPDHLRESVNLLSGFPSGKEMVNIFPLNSLKAGAGKGG